VVLSPTTGSTGVVHYRLADQRVSQVLELGHGLLVDNAEHVAACCRIEAPDHD